ncbi:MAG: hypothetical protein KDD89_10355 [Anaerolineales bacterium]|nr:hypothetical protein [Anaerolineales bacterium]
MSAIGFVAKTADDFGRIQLQAAQNGEVVAVDHGREGYYIRWALGNGPEVWVQANAQKEMVWLNPHFSGTTSLRMSLVSHIPRTAVPLDGSFYAIINPDPDNLEKGLVDLVFDLPDDALHRDLALPVVRQVQLAAFAQRLDAFDDEAAYMQAQEGGMAYAVESLVASGLFVQPGELPEARVLLSGRVLAAQLLVNPATGLLFHWARVKTLGGEVDVVADPAVVHGVVRVGGVVSGAFWVSGRVLAD